MSSENDFSHYVQRAQKTHMSIKVDYKSHSLFDTHRKIASSLVLIWALKTNLSLALYSDSIQTADLGIFYPILS